MIDEVLACLSVWSEVKNDLHGPADATATPSSLGLTFPLPAYPYCPRKLAVKRVSAIMNKNSSEDDIANVNFCTTTTYMERPAPTPIEPLLSTINIYGT